MDSLLWINDQAVKTRALSTTIPTGMDPTNSIAQVNYGWNGRQGTTDIGVISDGHIFHI